jgi:hypothetical protein
VKCKNCGAELNNGRCAYCGSFFSEDMRYMKLKAPQIDEDLSKKILFKGSPCRDDDSRMHKVLIEVTCIGDTERHFIEGI